MPVVNALLCDEENSGLGYAILVDFCDVAAEVDGFGTEDAFEPVEVCKLQEIVLGKVLDESC